MLVAKEGNQVQLPYKDSCLPAEVSAHWWGNAIPSLTQSLTVTVAAQDEMRICYKDLHISK